jgi:hypothetical protein
MKQRVSTESNDKIARNEENAVGQIKKEKSDDMQTE